MISNGNTWTLNKYYDDRNGENTENEENDDRKFDNGFNGPKTIITIRKIFDSHSDTENENPYNKMESSNYVRLYKYIDVSYSLMVPTTYQDVKTTECIQFMFLKSNIEIDSAIRSFDLVATQLLYYPIYDAQNITYIALAEKEAEFGKTPLHHLIFGRTCFSQAAKDDQTIYEWFRTLRRVNKYASRGIHVSNDAWLDTIHNIQAKLTSTKNDELGPIISHRDHCTKMIQKWNKVAVESFGGCIPLLKYKEGKKFQTTCKNIQFKWFLDEQIESNAHGGNVILFHKIDESHLQFAGSFALESLLKLYTRSYPPEPTKYLMLSPNILDNVKNQLHQRRYAPYNIVVHEDNLNHHSSSTCYYFESPKIDRKSPSPNVHTLIKIKVKDETVENFRILFHKGAVFIGSI